MHLAGRDRVKTCFYPFFKTKFSPSVKDNILFGRPYKEKRYLKSIAACDIEHDIEMFPDGNDTEVGERK